jgi:antirestriction protein ArdC
LNEITEDKAYEKLTPLRQWLINEVIKNLKEGGDKWTKGWIALGAPKSAITGKSYRGVNNLYLTLMAKSKGFKVRQKCKYIGCFKFHCRHNSTKHCGR